MWAVRCPAGLALGCVLRGSDCGTPVPQGQEHRRMTGTAQRSNTPLGPHCLRVCDSDTRTSTALGESSGPPCWRGKGHCLRAWLGSWRMSRRVRQPVNFLSGRKRKSSLPRKSAPGPCPFLARRVPAGSSPSSLQGVSQRRVPRRCVAYPVAAQYARGRAALCTSAGWMGGWSTWLWAVGGRTPPL